MVHVQQHENEGIRSYCISTTWLFGFPEVASPPPPLPPLPPGLVADCSLTDYVPLSCGPHSTDNDGLWTSWLVASEALRFSVTRDPAARENAWALFTGLRFLVNVSHANTVLRDALVELLKFLYCQE